MTNNGSDKKRIWIILGICGFFLLASCLLGRVFFETNDDETINLLAAGAYGPTMHLIYQNVILGAFLRLLFQTVRTVNWYLILMLFVNAAAIFTICLLLTEKMDLGRSVFLTTGVNVLLLYQFYNELQYTKNAALYTAVGGMFLLRGVWAVRQGKPATRDSILACVWMCLGFMVRRDAFLCAAAATAAALLPALLFPMQDQDRQRKVEDSQRRGQDSYRKAQDSHQQDQTKTSRLPGGIRSLIPLFLPTFLGLVICFGVNFAADRFDPTWADYMRYNDARTELLDYGVPDYKEHKEELKALGIDRTDLELLKNWDYMDPEKYSYETLQALIRIRGGSRMSRLKVNRTTLHAAARSMREALQSSLIPAAALGILVVSVLLLNAQGILSAILLMLCVFAEYWYLTCQGRLAWRAECGVWLSALLLLAMTTALQCAGKLRVKKERILYPVLAALVLGGICLADLLHVFFKGKGGQIAPRSGSYERILSEINAQQDAANEQDAQIYLFDTMTISGRPIIGSVWDITGKKAGLYRHIGLLGGWAGGSPAGQYYLRAAGIDNPIRALAQDTRTVLVSGEDMAGLMEKYLQKACGADLVLEQTGALEDVPVWKIRRED